MAFCFGKGKTTKVSLILNIQSDLVEGALYDLESTSDNLPVYVSSNKIIHKTEVTGIQLTKAMLKSLHEVVAILIKDGLAILRQKKGVKNIKIDQVHIGLSSPWIVSRAKTLSIDYKDDKAVSESLINSIVEKEIAEIKAKNDVLTIVDQKILDIKINGYSIENYQGKKATNLKLSFAISLSQETILKKIEKSLEHFSHYIDTYNIKIHGGLFLAFTALRSALPNQREFIFVSVHGEMTDIVVVKDAVCAYIGSFPMGTNTILRKLAYISKKNHTTASSLLSLYEDNKLEAHEKAKMDKIMTPIMKQWQSECTAHEAPRLAHLVAIDLYGLFKKSLTDAGLEVIQNDGGELSKENPNLQMYSIAINNMI